MVLLQEEVLHQAFQSQAILPESQMPVSAKKPERRINNERRDEK